MTVRPEAPKKALVVFWFRRDLRLHDNCGLFHALQSGYEVLPVFIFDRAILDKLDNKNDRRVSFIHRQLERLQKELAALGSSLLVEYGAGLTVWKKLISDYSIKSVFTNHDYEPYARRRDEEVTNLLSEHEIEFFTFKDQVIFEKDEIVNSSGKPFAVFTPYRNQWRKKLHLEGLTTFPSINLSNSFIKSAARSIPTLSFMGFESVDCQFDQNEIPDDLIKNYDQTRNFPGLNGTSRLGPHLRFGTISVRQLVDRAEQINETFVDELIWREFFMMNLWHHPHLVDQPFRENYRTFKWRTDERPFKKWCEGKTGFPIIDAGMRELISTGFMHNRVRMITANFLTRLLMIDWRLGERWFAKHLLDFELASNVGNWQWSAGCGVDAAPYFRIFNPYTQQQKFDPDFTYIKRWVREFGTVEYPAPMIDYSQSRQAALKAFKSIF